MSFLLETIAQVFLLINKAGNLEKEVIVKIALDQGEGHLKKSNLYTGIPQRY